MMKTIATLLAVALLGATPAWASCCEEETPQPQSQPTIYLQDAVNAFGRDGQGNARLKCVHESGNRDDALEACGVPNNEATIYGIYVLGKWHAREQWGQDHCVPLVPRGYKCSYRGFSYTW